MLLAQVGMGDAGLAAMDLSGIVVLFAAFFSLMGLLSGLIAFATSFAWRRRPRLDEIFAAGAVICFACYVAIWIEWGRMPTNWQIIVPAFIGPSIGILSAWRSHMLRSEKDGH